MNAPATPEAVATAAKLEFLPLGRLKPSGTHIQALRRARFDKKALDELAESIRKVGVLQPIVARPALIRIATEHTSEDPTHEIVAGERRWLAAEAAGLELLPVNVHVLTDEQVLEIQLIENLQREGLHELEEAEGYDELMRLKKINADALAELVGRSRSYVYARTKLLALCPEARKAFYAGELDASRALLVARIGHHDTQRQALKDITRGRFGDGEPMNYREAHRHLLEHYMLALKSAPFDVGDAQLLPRAGTCAACPKRSGNQRDLFGDVKSADICTDPKCFDDKRQAHFAVARKRLEDQGKKVIHGDAAKKIMPRWEEGDRFGADHLQGGYVRLDATTYASGRGRKVRELLGDDYEPVLLQHPATGKTIELATQQAVAKASQSPAKRGSARAGKAKPKGPDVDEQLLERLVKLIHEKAPKEFGKAHLTVLASRLLSDLNTRSEERAVVALRWGWPKSALEGGTYYSSAKLPAPAFKLDARGLLLVMFELVFLADRYHRKPLLDLFGIDEAKTRQQIIEERKAAAATARKISANATTS